MLFTNPFSADTKKIMHIGGRFMKQAAQMMSESANLALLKAHVLRFGRYILYYIP